MRDELFGMFKYPSMIKSAAFCAATFGFLAAALKNGIVLVPEASEVRICNILAMGYGIFFGPAGAWGVAVGNVIGDMSGSLTVLSPFGCLGNFLSAWIPYKIWCVLGARFGESPTARPSLRASHLGVRLILGGICSVVCCAAPIAIAADIFDFMPAANWMLMLFLNNAPATVLGILLFLVLCLVPAKVLPYWRDLMAEERSLAFAGSQARRLYAVVASSLVLAAGIVVYLLVNGLSLNVSDSFGQWSLIAVLAIFCLLVIALTASCRWRVSEHEGIVEL